MVFAPFFSNSIFVLLLPFSEIVQWWKGNFSLETYLENAGLLIFNSLSLIGSLHNFVINYYLPQEYAARATL